MSIQNALVVFLSIVSIILAILVLKPISFAANISINSNNMQKRPELTNQQIQTKAAKQDKMDKQDKQ